MNWLELFACGGGASLGIRAAGGHALACVEWDAHAVATLEAAGFPAVEADLKTWSWTGAKPDALWASFPCQCWSGAGKRLGALDERNGWPWTLRIVDETSPTWTVLENVPGLTHHSATGCGDPETCPGCYLQRVILVQLAERYEHVQHIILDCADYGIPQHRRRLFVIAGPRPVRWPEPTHGDPATIGASLFGPALLPWVSMGEALGFNVIDSEGRAGNVERSPYLPSGTVGTGGQAMVVEHGNSRVMKRDNNDPRPTRERRELDITDRPSDVVTAGYSPTLGGHMYVVEYGGTRGGAGYMHQTTDDPAPTVNTGGDIRLADSSVSQSQRVCDPSKPAPTLDAGGESHRAPWVPTGIREVRGHGMSGRHGDRTKVPTTEPSPCIRASSKGSGPRLEWTWEGPSLTVAASDVKGASAHPEKRNRASDALAVGTHGQRRRLSVDECRILQGFPPGHPFQGTKTAQYMQVGNACPPRMVQLLAEAVRDALGESSG